ncbi:unnamed protein product [Gulo gulo]|uniref:Uncharacterized protein n=1 Tax=Gulo gulo TaxID=48420 RepID=A0A9X9Q7R1_GULGU|nr:unnamed protein product [Gulo gulo]
MEARGPDGCFLGDVASSPLTFHGIEESREPSGQQGTRLPVTPYSPRSRLRRSVPPLVQAPCSGGSRMAPAPLCSGPGHMEVKKGEGLLEVLGREGSFEAVKPLPGSPSLPGSYSWVSCAAGTMVPVIGLDHSWGESDTQPAEPPRCPSPRESVGVWTNSVITRSVLGFISVLGVAWGSLDLEAAARPQRSCALPCRFLGGAHPRARGGPARRDPPAAAADRERRVCQPGHGGLHHAPARGQSAGPGTVCAAAAGCRGPGGCPQH